jgi:solute carrier family 25 carnitine/acylcarnitine transporter 20/29
MTSDDDGSHQAAMKILLCGGIAGIVTWGSVFPLDQDTTAGTDNCRSFAQGN